MFTGIITHLAPVKSFTRLDGGASSLRLENPFESDDPVCEGESVAVNGCCLTCDADSGPQGLIFFLSQETLRKTTMSALSAGVKVNLERAMKLGDRLGGHLVSGHVDTVGEICELVEEADSLRLTISFDRSFSALVIDKGSITINGVSMTINALSDSWRDSCEHSHNKNDSDKNDDAEKDDAEKDHAESDHDKQDRSSITVNVIPQTQGLTTFGISKVGDTVNLEFDLMGKYVLRVHALSARGAPDIGENIAEKTDAQSVQSILSTTSAGANVAERTKS